MYITHFKHLHFLITHRMLQCLLVIANIMRVLLHFLELTPSDTIIKLHHSSWAQSPPLPPPPPPPNKKSMILSGFLPTITFDSSVAHTQISRHLSCLTPKLTLPLHLLQQNIWIYIFAFNSKLSHRGLTDSGTVIWYENRSAHARPPASFRRERVFADLSSVQNQERESQAGNQRSSMWSCDS